MSYPGGNGWDQPQQPYQPGYQPPNHPGQQHPQQPYQGYQDHPQQQYYGGYPGGPQPPAPKKNKTALWVTIGALVVVIAVGVTLLFVMTGNNDPAPQAAPSSSPVAPPPPSPSNSSPPTSTEANNQVDAVTPGWQGILSTKDGVAYDLPPDNWDTRPGFISGYDSGSVKASIHESTTFRPEACAGVKGSNRGKAGFMTAGDNAPDVAARGSVRLWAQAAGTGEDGKVPEVPLPATTQIPIDGGKLQATSSTVTFTPPADEDCPAPSVQVTSAAFKVGTQTVCFLLVTDLQVPDALPAEDAKKILASLRPQS
ncbi:hypothetical protein [Amycolatopsis sp.]|jgi:hypothetical protein|uniref:hypothetical protein n=1 Tax=Amycolatopsis sp. TaxID=37632 RepID=UPI002E0B9215|nr:hypothetical protein [Amycolatopsis sp.]